MHLSEEGILALITQQLWAMVPASSHVTPPPLPARVGLITPFSGKEAEGPLLCSSVIDSVPEAGQVLRVSSREDKSPDDTITWFYR